MAQLRVFFSSDYLHVSHKPFFFYQSALICLDCFSVVMLCINLELVDSLFIVAPIVCGSVVFGHCIASFAIFLPRKRELLALL